MIDFDRNIFIETVETCVERTGISHEDLADLIGIHPKTLAKYLKKGDGPNPTLPVFVRLFQILNTSPSNLLISKGPKYINPKAMHDLFLSMEQYSNITKPAYFVIKKVLSLMEYEDIEMTKDLLYAYAKKKGLLKSR